MPKVHKNEKQYLLKGGKVSKSTFQQISHIAICVYNNSLSTEIQFMDTLGIKVELNCYNLCVEANVRRLSLSEISLTDAAYAARQSMKSTRKRQEQKNVNLEDQLHVAGIAD